MTTYTSLKRLFLCQALCTVLLVFAFMPSLSALSRGYQTNDTDLKPGMIVMLSGTNSADNPDVERATPEGVDRIIGVATTVDASVATIASSSQSIYVETGGDVLTYVSDIQGEVHKGDLLTISSLRGIAAKASSGSPYIIGVATEDANNAKNQETHTIQTKNGEQQTKIGLIKVNIDSRGKTWGQLSGGSSSLKQLGRAVSGKDVSQARVLLALVLFFVVMTAEGSILYGAISSGILSLGRNPLAKKVILREVGRVVFVAFFVLTFGLGAVYTILSV